MNGGSVLLALALASGTALAADGKTPYYIDASTKDSRSADFIFEIKEQFRQSSTLRVVDSEGEAPNHIKIAAMELASGDAIAYSAVWTWRGTGKLDVYGGAARSCLPCDPACFMCTIYSGSR